MAGPFRSPGDFTHFVQLESAYGTSPGALAGTDAWMSRAASLFKRVIEYRDRDMDADGTASVVSTQLGRESGTFDTGDCDFVPSGNASTITAPDMDAFFEAHFGTKLTGTTHTILDAGSTTTLLKFAAGSGATSGVAVGQMIAVNVDATFGWEVREVTIVSTDDVTVDRALSAAPAAAQVVKLGVTYRLEKSNLKSLHLWEFVGQGNNFRHSAGGAIPRNMELGCDFTQKAPVVSVKFSGETDRVLAQTSTSYPTPTTAGLPLIPSETKVWIGTAKQCLSSAKVTSDNSAVPRNNLSCFLYPTGVKRTENNGRFVVNLDLSIDMETGTIEGYYDGERSATAYDVLVQLGIVPGNIVAFRAKKFIPKGDVGENDGLISIDLSGRCYATAEEDELVVAVI